MKTTIKKIHHSSDTFISAMKNHELEKVRCLAGYIADNYPHKRFHTYDDVHYICQHAMLTKRNIDLILLCWEVWSQDGQEKDLENNLSIVT